MNAGGPVDITGSSRGCMIMMCAVLRSAQHTTQFNPKCSNAPHVCGLWPIQKPPRSRKSPWVQPASAALQVQSNLKRGTQTMVCWHSVWSLCGRALIATARKGWWTSFTFGLTPCLAEWRGRRKCVKWAGGARAAERRLAVFISVTDCRHCLHFLLLSPTVFPGINAPILTFDGVE